jgi:hypothetical protein
MSEEICRIIARHERNHQWHFMERIVAHGTLWYCPWNTKRLPEAADEFRDGWLSALPLRAWVTRHADWFVQGEWDKARDAFPFQVTAAGQTALAQRELYDMEPVPGGLVAPGWDAIPLPYDDPRWRPVGWRPGAV